MPISAINVHKSQHLHNADHGGHLCTGMNNSLSLLESWPLPPSSLSLAGQTRVSSPSLFFSTFSHFTHLPPDGLLTEIKLKSHSNSSLSKLNSRRKAFILFPSGVLTGVQPTCLPNSIIIWSQQLSQQRERQCQKEYRRRPTPLQKNDRDRITPITGTRLRVHCFQAVGSRQNLDANQSN